ncbi:hypothetical protein BDV26DRAFT_279480 [Aspergillus bertholletiae]|uniref:Uncharacterized protein n=1 Tax=Aspergillus bertholletiae TaxID=1226010 RepID=A0A5N7BFL8_9EURO|nr:hypothetical protein BDV26DRAFT_279480 [Aspergillus bertholletiae]
MLMCTPARYFAYYTRRCRFDKGYWAQDISCVICGVPNFVMEERIRDKNLERYKWFTLQAIRAENYHYEKDWDTVSLSNHDLPLEVLELDEIEIHGVHYGERLERLEPSRFNKVLSELVHDICTEYPYATVHPECLNMMRRLVEYRRVLIKTGVAAGPKQPTTLSQFYEMFEQRITRAQSNDYYPTGLSGTLLPLRVIEPHYYYFQDTNLYRNFSWAWGEQRAYVEALPNELQDMFYNNLHPFVNPMQICDRSLPSWMWRDMLFNQQDYPAISNTDDDVPTYGAEGVWNWERLVRTLAQVEVFEPGNPLQHAPLRLRNRRRIWRILEKAKDEDIEEWFDAKRESWNYW